MLPNGITGFRNLKDSYIPEQEKRIFQRFCYSIATRYHCEVLSFDLDLASKNFYSAEIKAEQGRFYLLENAYYPWIAFAKNLDFTKIEFVESPFNLTDTSVNVLTLPELEQSWHDIVGKLNKAELEQIEYWKSNIIGDIIFPCKGGCDRVFAYGSDHSVLKRSAPVSAPELARAFMTSST